MLFFFQTKFNFSMYLFASLCVILKRSNVFLNSIFELFYFVLFVNLCVRHADRVHVCTVLNGARRFVNSILIGFY